jgi:homoserine O-acetyltransferase
MRPATIFLLGYFAGVIALPAAAQAPPPATVVSLGECRLRSGAVLPNCRVAYRAYGKPSAARDNVVLIPTWLLGRSEDYHSFLTTDPLVDTTRFYVIVVDALADGLSSSPSNTVPAARPAFRDLTVGDMVDTQYRLLTERLGISHLRAVIGFSMGGAQAIEWAVRYPTFVDRTVPIAGTPRVGTFNRLALTAMLAQIEDGKRAGIPPDSLWPSLARTEMLFIVTPIGLNSRGTDSVTHDIAVNAANYRAWNLDDYAAQIAALRRYDLSADYGDMRRAAARVRTPMLAVYSWDDHMVTPDAMSEFAKMVGADTLSIASTCGHIMIFCEQKRVGAATRAFIAREPVKP